MPPEKNRSAALDGRVTLTAVEAVSPTIATLVWPASWPLWWPSVARIAILLLTDMTALGAAAILGYLLWARSVLHQPPSLYTGLIPLLIIFPLGYAGARLYPGFGLGAVESLRRFSLCTSFVFLLLTVALFVLKLHPAYPYSRLTFAIAWGTSLFLVPLGRLLVLFVARRWQWWEEPVVLVGSGQWAQNTVHALEHALSLGYRPVGVLSTDLPWHDQISERLPILCEPEQALRLAERGVCIALVEERQNLSGAIISWLQQHFRYVMVIRECGDLPVEGARVCNLGSVLGVQYTNNLLNPQNRLIKRALDVMLGTLFLLLAAPILAVGALLVKLSSGGPAFFRQQREGLDGHPITIWKLRTMHLDAEQRLEKFLTDQPNLRQEWEEHLKLAQDPRIIPWVGHFLRRSSLDELPQLWSVVIGEMSLVGPRPFPQYHLERFPAEFRELRRRVRPGLTGMWQVMVRSNGGIGEQQEYDTYYIHNWSLWLDLYVLARTGYAVLASRGAC
jgi:Undecaprenyl-phosphate galactose phosphotransferase WbaP